MIATSLLDLMVQPANKAPHCTKQGKKQSAWQNSSLDLENAIYIRVSTTNGDFSRISIFFSKKLRHPLRLKSIDEKSELQASSSGSNSIVFC
jgi:hypothetical protein